MSEAAEAVSAESEHRNGKQRFPKTIKNCFTNLKFETVHLNREKSYSQKVIFITLEDSSVYFMNVPV